MSGEAVCAESTVPLRALISDSQNGLSKRVGEQGDELPVLRLADISSGAIDESAPRSIRLTEKERAKYELHRGDLLCIRVNGSKGLVGRMVPFTSAHAWAYCDHFIRLRPDPEKADYRYLAYFLNSAPVRRVLELGMVSSAGQHTVSQGTVLELGVPLLSMDRQREIVAEIEKQFSRLDEAVANLQRVKANLRRYKVAVLAQLIVGLDGTMSDQPSASAVIVEGSEVLGVSLPELPKDWCWTSVGAIGKVRGGKRLPSGNGYAAGRTDFPYLRVTDFHDFGIDDTSLQYLSEQTSRAIWRYTIGKRDVYVSIAGSIGLVGQVPSHLDGANLTENAAKVTDLQGVEGKYLVYWLASPIGRQLIAKSTMATTQSKLALFRIEKLPVPLPPLAEQHRIVAEVDRRLSIVREVEAEVDANLKRAQALRQAVLRRAFAGP